VAIDAHDTHWISTVSNKAEPSHGDLSDVLDGILRDMKDTKHYSDCGSYFTEQAIALPLAQDDS
jgi:hypothetical protein